MDPITWDPLPPGLGRDQPDPGVIDGVGSYLRHTVLLEHGTPRERVLCVLSGIDWRCVRCVPELRSLPAIRVLRTGDHSQVFHHRDLGLDPEGIWRDEARSLFVRR